MKIKMTSEIKSFLCVIGFVLSAALIAAFWQWAIKEQDLQVIMGFMSGIPLAITWIGIYQSWK